MFGLSFLSPLFLAGAAAAAIPVLLHLFHRRAEPVVPFAAMRYLKKAPVEQASRRRMKEWLLLALRVTALVLLAFAFARPYLVQSTAALEAPATLVLVDTSASMSAPGQFERARALATAAIRDAGPTDVVGLMTFGAATTLVAPLSTDRAGALQAIASVQPGAGTSRYSAALGRAAEALGSHRGRIVVVTDLQESGWDSTQPSQVPEDVTVDVADTGSPDANVAVLALRVENNEAIALVRNFSSKPVTHQVAFTIDGGSVGSAPVSLDAEGTAEARIALGSRNAGALAAAVDDRGGYVADNMRYAVLDPSDAPVVLMVTTSGADADAFYLRRAIAVSEGARSFRTRLISGPQFSGLGPDALDDVAVIALSGTRGIEHQGRERLAQFVRAGGGLLIAAGAGVDVAVVKEALDGLVATTWRERSGPALRFAPDDSRHPAFRLTGGAGTLGNVAFRRTVLLTPGPSASVVARFTDGTPALVDEPAGQGRVLVFASDLNEQWNDLPVQPAFVPFVHEGLRYLASARGGRSDVLVGELADAAAQRPGVVRVTDTRGGSHEVAVNVDPRESDPARMTAEAFTAGISRLRARAAQEVATANQEREDSHRLWQYALLVMMLTLAAEGVLGRRVA